MCGSFLTNIHGCFHETLLTGGKFSKQLLLSLSRSLSSEKFSEKNNKNYMYNSHNKTDTITGERMTAYYKFSI